MFEGLYILAMTINDLFFFTFQVKIKKLSENILQLQPKKTNNIVHFGYLA